MKRRRVKITGIGPVTPAGIGRESFWKGILEPVSRVRPYTKISDEFGEFVAAYIEDFKVEKYLDGFNFPKGASRQSQFAIAGAVLALQDANITVPEIAGNKTVVLTGSCVFDFGGIVGSIDNIQKRGARGASPRIVFASGVGSVPSAVAQTIGLDARTLALSNQCCSGLDAIGYAATLVANGEADVAICGGADAPLCRTPLLEFRAGELISETIELAQYQARPFDLWRTTAAIGEGCAMFVLEPDSSPREGYCYIDGYSFSNDKPGDICSGLFQAARMALAQAHLRPSDIEVLNAWGPGDRRVDRGEVAAMEQLFGGDLPEIAATSIKGAIGSPLGAAPAIQIATAAMGQKFSAIPPTTNWEYPDPDCRLNLSGKKRFVAHSRTLVNSHGLGAVNCAMVLQRC